MSFDMGAEEGRQFLEVMVAKSRSSFSLVKGLQHVLQDLLPLHRLPALASSSKDSGDPLQHGCEASWFGPGQQLAVLDLGGGYYFSVVPSGCAGV